MAASVILPVGALCIAMISVQYGATFAKRLFPVVGAEGTTALRLGLSAVFLLPFLRPRSLRISRRNLPALLGYGFSLGSMNLLFYSALHTIPLGIAVALEFTGPLALAVALSRRWVDLLWAALAAAGVVFLLPFGASRHSLDRTGLLYALGAGACWASYSVFGQKAGGDHGSSTAALGVLIAAVVVVPVGVARAGATLLSPSILLPAVLVALLSSALPYPMEIIALTRLPTRAYGTLTSAEPALGALMGALFLHEHLTPVQIAAVSAIMAASLGTAATLRPTVVPN